MEILNSKGQSQKLLRCNIINKNSEQSERFVEFEHYKLWSYMMFHKHGLKIQDISLWLWIEEQDYLAREELYSRAPHKLEVSKLEVFLFDEHNGLSHVIHRYCLSDESAQVEKILLSHISPELVAAGNFEMSHQMGYCVKSDIKDLDKLVLGLSDQDERLWYREK
jgi:hypothetical protein